MRSKTFQRILDKTPKDIDAFIRLYGDIVVSMDRYYKNKGYSKDEINNKIRITMNKQSNTMKEIRIIYKGKYVPIMTMIEIMKEVRHIQLNKNKSNVYVVDSYNNADFEIKKTHRGDIIVTINNC